MSVAKLCLGDFLKEENHCAEATSATIEGKMTSDYTTATPQAAVVRPLAASMVMTVNSADSLPKAWGGFNGIISKAERNENYTSAPQLSSRRARRVLATI
jgi:hypothetical protein